MSSLARVLIVLSAATAALPVCRALSPSCSLITRITELTSAERDAHCAKAEFTQPKLNLTRHWSAQNFGKVYGGYQYMPGFRGVRWTGGSETCLYYLLSRFSFGSIAEQGPFLGASTLSIAAGIAASTDPNRLFITTDAFPLAARESKDAASLYPNRWQYNAEGNIMEFIIDNHHVGNLSIGAYNEVVKPYVDVTGGHMATLVSNLVAAGLQNKVVVAVGSHIPVGIPFQLVHSDSTHNDFEVTTNLPPLLDVIDLLDSSSACLTINLHDIGTRNKRLPPVRLEAPSSPLQSRVEAIATKKTSRGRPCRIVDRIGAGALYAFTLQCI